eukprot:2263879-Pleurochrysis_carterae.AAC.2
MKSNCKHGVAAKLRETHFTKEYTRYCIEVKARLPPTVVVPPEGGVLVNIFYLHTCSLDDPRLLVAQMGKGRIGKIQGADATGVQIVQQASTAETESVDLTAATTTKRMRGRSGLDFEKLA